MRLSATGWLTTVVALLAIALLGPTAPQLLRDLGGDSFPDVALSACSLVLLVVALWAATITVGVLLGVSGSVVAAITPAFARRTLLLGVAGALVVAPAHAEQQAPGHTADRAQHAPHTVDGLPLPDRPDVAAVHRTSPAPAPTPQPRTERLVEVRPGDSLWAIAARALPAGASDAEIARATRRWHAANRTVIGADPDLIVPHQLLTPPSGKDRP